MSEGEDTDNRDLKSASENDNNEPKTDKGENSDSIISRAPVRALDAIDTSMMATMMGTGDSIEALNISTKAFLLEKSDALKALNTSTTAAMLQASDSLDIASLAANIGDFQAFEIPKTSLVAGQLDALDISKLAGNTGEIEALNLPTTAALMSGLDALEVSAIAKNSSAFRTLNTSNVTASMDSFEALDTSTKATMIGRLDALDTSTMVALAGTLDDLNASKVATTAGMMDVLSNLEEAPISPTVLSPEKILVNDELTVAHSTPSTHSHSTSEVSGSFDDPGAVAFEIEEYLYEVRAQVAFQATYDALQAYGDSLDDPFLLFVAVQLLNILSSGLSGNLGIVTTALGAFLAIVHRLQTKDKESSE